MKIQHLGTDYGGWWIDVDLLPEEGVIIDAGVGTDMTFTEALHELKPGIRAVLIDHTDESAEYVLKHRAHPWVTFIKSALITSRHEGAVEIFRHKTAGSESVYNDHNFVNPENSYTVPGVHLGDLVREHKPFLVKLDIEGAEYGVIRECLGVPQVCVEFHHRMMKRFTEADTNAAIQFFLDHGYRLAHRTPTDEVLLILERT
jgi:FkbM family methyltransferase